MTINWNQFACCCSIRIKPLKGSSVWVAPSSLLVGTTTGSRCDYWQTTSHISTAPGPNISVSACAINTPFTAILLTSINEKKWFYESRVYFCPVFLFIALRLWYLCHTVDAGRILKRDLKKQTQCNSNYWITQTVGCLRHRTVYSVTQASTHYIHTGILHTNKLKHTHHSQKSNTCTRLAWQSHNRELLF